MIASERWSMRFAGSTKRSAEVVESVVQDATELLHPAFFGYTRL